MTMFIIMILIAQFLLYYFCTLFIEFNVGVLFFVVVFFFDFMIDLSKIPVLFVCKI